MKVSLRAGRAVADPQGHTVWQSEIRELRLDPQRCAVLVCDVWDSHWSRGAVQRLEAMIPRMNHTLARARTQGMQIIHAPSDTMDFYAAAEARSRILRIPDVTPPPDRALPDPPLPIDDADGGSDTGETQPQRTWTRQHAGLHVDQAWDVISDAGTEVYGWLQHKAVEWVFILGVHTNMCVLHRSFGIKQLVRWNVNVALIRDLTDTMYNPLQSPYVSHREGTRLVIGYIEKFWCPSTHSQYLVGL